MMRVLTMAAGVLSLAVVLAAAGPARAQAKDEKKPETPDVQKQLDELRKELAELRKQLGLRPMPAVPNIPTIRLLGRTDARLGLLVDRPGDALADQLNLKEGKGLVVVNVIPDSAAAKAGLKEHDVLLQFAGKDVPRDPLEFAKMVGDAKADTAVEIVLLRKGKQETVKDVKLPEAKPTPGLNFRPIPVPRPIGVPLFVFQAGCR
jgi:serine protease Do